MNSPNSVFTFIAQWYGHPVYADGQQVTTQVMNSDPASVVLRLPALQGTVTRATSEFTFRLPEPLNHANSPVAVRLMMLCQGARDAVATLVNGTVRIRWGFLPNVPSTFLLGTQVTPSAADGSDRFLITFPLVY